MSGVLRGTVFAIETVNPFVDPLPWTQTCFAGVSSFFDSHSAYTRVASYYGISGSGFDGPTGSFPSGYSRWGVWRKANAGDSWDVWIGVNEQQNFLSENDPSGSWNLSAPNTADAGVGVIAGWHSSGVAWNGTSVNNGKDSFATATMWKSGTVLFPNVNTVFGNHYPSRSVAMGVGVSSVYANATASIVADDDSFTIHLFTPETPLAASAVHFTKYVAASSSFTLPYVSWVQTAPVLNTPLALFSSNTTPLGGISVKKTNDTAPLGLSGSYGFYAHVPTYHIDGTYNFTAVYPPNPSIVELYETPLALVVDDFKRQYVGYTDFVRASTNNIIPGSRFGSGSRIALMGDSFDPISVPWSSSFGFLTGASYVATFYTSSATILSGASYAHTSQSSLREIITQATADVILYRGIVTGSYYYGTTNPPVPSASNVVVVRKR